MNRSPTRVAEAHLDALNRLYDAVSEEIVENPDALSALRERFLPLLEACQTADQEPDLSNGAGEDVRESVIQLARAKWCVKGAQEVDDDAGLSVADDAVWVQAWVRLSDEDLVDSGHPALVAFAGEH